MKTHYVPYLSEVELDGVKQPIPSQLPWYVASRLLTFVPLELGLIHELKLQLWMCVLFDRYPDGLGWQVNVGKQIIRKSKEYKKLQQFLVYETDVVRRVLHRISPTPLLIID